MAFNGRGIPADELVELLAGYAAGWDGLLTPSGGELARYIADACGRPELDTIAVGNRARREFVRIYGEGNRHRPRTLDKGVGALSQVVRGLSEPHQSPHQSPPQSRAELPDLDRWDEPARPRIRDPWRVEPQPPPDDEAEMLRRWREDHHRDRQRWATNTGPRVFEHHDALPIGLTLFGDQHVDDDGCDVDALVRHVSTVAVTPGLYGVNLGDVTNNWTGKLAHLWGHQSTTHEEAARRASWLMRSIPWLCVVSGNHDDWSDGTLRLAMVERGPLHFAKVEARLEFRIGDAPPIRLVARHQFKGSSMWNAGHALKKEAVMGDGWGDVYVQGHHHDSHVMTEERPDGRRVWTVKARGFKHFDSYAHRLQFHDHQHGHAPTLVLDPMGPPADRVRVVFDVEEAAAMVGWLRQRRAA